MYYLVYCNDFSGDFVLIDTSTNLMELAERRTVSGDLIVDDTGKVVQEPSWLFDWELKQPNCYARRKMKDPPSLNYGYGTYEPPRRPTWRDRHTFGSIRRQIVRFRKVRKIRQQLTLFDV
jgi:hypothetical protein